MHNSNWRWWLGMSVGLVVGVAAGCAGEEDDGDSVFTSGAPGGGGAGGMSSGGAGGAGGESLCAEDCASIDTPPCLESICNDGSHPGQVGACVVVHSATGTDCDDGLFCTVDDFCEAGACTGGPQNTCGDTPPPCTVVTCNESSRDCSTADAEDGEVCIPTTLCEVSGVCTGGECEGVPKDCTFSPLSECNSNLVCDPGTGQCGGTPDPAKNGDPCSLTGDQCMTGKTCNDGACEGGAPEDCSFLTVDCFNGVCNPQTGGCIQEVVPAGGTCFDGITECNSGTCDASGACNASPLPDGMGCNDFNSCTSGDICDSGSCEGAPIVGCEVYFEENFDAGCPPAGWTLAQDWECGAPTNVGPPTALSAPNVIATQIDANYSLNQAYDTTIAQTPPIDLSSSTEPALAFWAYVDTEGSSFDGFNVKISTDNGQSFTQLTGVSPAYNLTVGGQPAWGGHLQAAGYQQYLVDLAAFAGDQIILRFAFRTDGSIVYPGVYIDDVTVAEAALIPLLITTPSNLEDALSGALFNAPLAKAGGTSSSVWTIEGGTNIGWLSIDSMTGELSGTPTLADLGPVSVTVRVAEPTAPANYDEVTFDFTVVQTIFVQDFEGACPNGWTLTGDWQCGTPTAVGPTTAFSGLQVIATQIGGNYSLNQAFATTFAQSPALSLAGTTAPTLSFRAYVYTEGSAFDGFNVKVSTDGVIFTTLTDVSPAYTLTLAGEPAWGGKFSAAGYVEYTADLAAFAGQTVYVRFAFRTDGSVVYPGVYIDDVAILD